MDFPWGSSGLPQPPMDPALNLLNDPFLLDLDDKTLQVRGWPEARISCLRCTARRTPPRISPGAFCKAQVGSVVQCLMGGPSTSAAAAQDSEAGPSNKRPREDDCLAWLGDCGGANDGDGEVSGRGEDDDSGEECGGDRKGKRLGKQGKPMSQAALVKATREKARRERLNEW
jgi:hypothetical protein